MLKGDAATMMVGDVTVKDKEARMLRRKSEVLVLEPESGANTMSPAATSARRAGSGQ